MPRVKKEKKLKMQDIKKNPDIEKKHFIQKFIEHEREIMFCTTALFMILICVVIYIGTITIENKDKIEIYYDGSLKIRYNVDISGVSDIVTLGEDNIFSSTEGEKADSMFSVTNDSLTSVRYKVLLEVDKSMIEFDNCKDLQVNKDAIRLSINDGKEISLDTKDGGDYLIKSGFIGAGKTKEFILKAWIDKDLIKDMNKNHFHGRIVVLSDE